MNRQRIKHADSSWEAVSARCWFLMVEDFGETIGILIEWMVSVCKWLTVNKTAQERQEKKCL